MNIISLDTIFQHTAISVTGEKGTFTEIYKPKKRQQAEKLLTIADTLVEKAGFSPNQIEAVLSLQGPGSFTGLRLAYATAKAIQLKTNALFYPIPTLECLAFKYRNYAGKILALINANRGCYYGQIFQAGKALTKISDAPFEYYTDLLENAPTLLIAIDFQAATLPSNITLIEESPYFSLKMLDFYNQTKSTPTTDDYSAPVYIRKSDAEK